MNHRTRRVVMSAAGILLCGISIAFCRMADWGTDPFQTFCGGMERLTNLPFGILYLIINGMMLAGVLFLKRSLIGIATVLNMTLMGFVVEGAQGWLERYLQPAGPAGRAVYFAAGIVVLCVGASLYFTAGLGVSVYDAAALILTARLKVRFEWCRIGCDLFCVAVGCILGAPVGAGTVVTALCMGPLIEFFNIRLARPLLN